MGVSFWRVSLFGGFTPKPKGQSPFWALPIKKAHPCMSILRHHPQHPQHGEAATALIGGAVPGDDEDRVPRERPIQTTGLEPHGGSAGKVCACLKGRCHSHSFLVAVS